jgi:hypothetical protein
MARVIMYTYDTAYIGERFYFTRYFEYQQNRATAWTVQTGRTARLARVWEAERQVLATVCP